MHLKFENTISIRTESSRIIISIIYNLVYYFVALTITASGLMQLFNPFLLLEGMRLALPLPTPVLISIVAFIATLETLLGLMLILKLKVKTSLAISAALSLFLFIYTIFCFLQSVPGETGYFGGYIHCQFDFEMVIKNSVFLFAMVSLLLKESEISIE
jgi:hypothetical protein